MERHANESSNSKIGRVETRSRIYNFYKFYVLLDPIKLLDYPAEDVFDLINGLIDYNCRNDKDSGRNDGSVIRRKAKDDWF